jgi:(p)ppGpp synthase/HD superfamily hydrolase
MLDVAGNQLITAAAVFAAEAHSGQMRKELNEPYIGHPLRVGMLGARLGQSPEFIAALYLHDVVEDTTTPIEAIERLFPEPTVVLVKAWTKFWQKGVVASEVVEASKKAYYDNIIATPNAPLGKVLDRIDNLYDFAKMARRSVPKSHKWASKYHAKTITEFVPLLRVLESVGDDAHLEARKWFGAALNALEVVL